MISHRLQTSIDQMTRSVLMHGRTEKTYMLRPYLRLRSYKMRRSLAQLVFSEHSLALEKQRRTKKGEDKVPRQQRTCRLCAHGSTNGSADSIHVSSYSLESPEHILLECQASSHIVDLRARFLGQVKPLKADQSKLQQLRELLTSEDEALPLAQFFHEAMFLVDTQPWKPYAGDIPTTDPSTSSPAARTGETSDNEYDDEPEI